MAIPDDVKYRDGVFPTRNGQDIRHSSGLAEGISYAIEGTGIPELARTLGAKYVPSPMGEPQKISSGLATTATIFGMFIDPSPSSEVKLYRSVSKAELDDLLTTGTFNPGNNMEFKFFATFPSEAMKNWMYWQKLDCIDPATGAPYYELNALQFKIRVVD